MACPHFVQVNSAGTSPWMRYFFPQEGLGQRTSWLMRASGGQMLPPQGCPRLTSQRPVGALA